MNTTIGAITTLLSSGPTACSDLRKIPKLEYSTFRHCLDPETLEPLEMQ